MSIVGQDLEDTTGVVNVKISFEKPSAQPILENNDEDMEVSIEKQQDEVEQEEKEAVADVAPIEPVHSAAYLQAVAEAGIPASHRIINFRRYTEHKPSPLRETITALDMEDDDEEAVEEDESDDDDDEYSSDKDLLLPLEKAQQAVLYSCKMMDFMMMTSRSLESLGFGHDEDDKQDVSINGDGPILSPINLLLDDGNVSEKVENTCDMTDFMMMSSRSVENLWKEDSVEEWIEEGSVHDMTKDDVDHQTLEETEIKDDTDEGEAPVSMVGMSDKSDEEEDEEDDVLTVLSGRDPRIQRHVALPDRKLLATPNQQLANCTGLPRKRKILSTVKRLLSIFQNRR